MPTRFTARARLALLTALIVGAVGGCASSGVNEGQINLVSLEEEWQLGRQLEQDIARQLRLVNDRTALSYLNQMGTRIVGRTEMANLPWKFHIVDDPKINAFNIPGGHVYVNTGLIAAAGDASELAGVLAHEISHGVARHGTEQLSRAYGLNIIASLALGQNPAVYEQLLAQILASGSMAKFSRNAEREADELGVVFMHGAGYHPQGMARMFERLLEQRRSRPNAVQQFFATHPLTESRIDAIEQRAAQLPTSGLTRQEAGFTELKRRVGG